MKKDIAAYIAITLAAIIVTIFAGCVPAYAHEHEKEHAVAPGEGAPVQKHHVEAAVMFARAFYEYDTKTIDEFFAKHCVVWEQNSIDSLKEASEDFEAKVLRTGAKWGVNHVVVYIEIERGDKILDAAFVLYINAKGQFIGISFPEERLKREKIKI